MVISSYSDLDRISPMIKSIHFRKFLSKRLIKNVFKRCVKVKVISVSKYAYMRCDKNILGLIEKQGVKIIVRQNIGRPNILERVMK